MDKNKEKLSKFADVLSALRRERGISQKKAASDLGISQALLSHYEKGIRECGLDFVIRCSKYYGVTTDYLLGVSASRNGLESSDFEALGKRGEKRSASALTSAAKCLLDAAAVTDNREKNIIYDYCMLSLYRGALSLEKAGLLPEELFTLDLSSARELASAAIAVEKAKFALTESETPATVPENGALSALIEEAEDYIKRNLITE